MHLYCFLIQIAALFGHKKARLIVRGQKEMGNDEWRKTHVECHHGTVWIHVSSVGEFEQARPLIERLRQERPKQKIVLTFFSPSGYELRKNYDLVDEVLYLPFPTRANARWFLNALQPSIAIFVKYEFWPAYLRELKKRAIPTYSISAIFRPGQLFFRPWGKPYLQLLHCFTHIYVQDEASRQLLAKYGVQHCSIAGDTRFDRVQAVKANCMQANQARLTPVAQFAETGEHLIVAGSTWPKDEELLAQFISERPDVKLILAPHEIDEAHMHRIFQLFQGRYVRYSVIQHMPYAVSSQTILNQAQVLVMDTIGLLSSIYHFGQTAYIGGGFGVGIHNTIEASVYGIPVVFGPNYQHFREAKGLIAAGAARSIKNYSELEAALTTALDNHVEIGAKAAGYVESELGATDKIFKEIFV